METVFPPPPTRFEPGWHALRLRKLELQADPGVGRTGRRLRLVFDAHRLDGAGRPGRLVDRFDVFAPVVGDLASVIGPIRTLLMHLGLDPADVHPGRTAHGLVDRWVRGRIGPPDPASGGYQPLLESEPIGARTAEGAAVLSGGASGAGTDCRDDPRPGEGDQQSHAYPSADDATPTADPSMVQVNGRDADCDLAVTPVLMLKELGGRGPNRSRVARLIGTGGGPFDGVDLEVGRGQLFFLRLLFASTRVEAREGVAWTLVGEDEALAAFDDWVRRGLLEFNEDEPAYPEGRLAKNWHRLVRQFSPMPGLRGLLKAFPRAGGSRKYFAIRLLPGGMGTDLPPIHLLLADPPRRP